ncbi:MULTISPECIES: cupin-like domain-containing protein [Nocardia]|uniref:cupin-like domain-containing protein n=1 Tax=Nocardia TaxID=1817 RepID=UPI000BF01EF3|nr:MULTISPECIES: cupin-like domain-containing protein [Nocardia]MBF6139737.1 cupin-like domain-containing protein [Nocardia farcinica]MBF6185466.1 cupin-like domain-containing protein [Nocardia farcinica]MBF6250706.1 cupin-like domain-containing protein [Nocardia farcinica]MBF6257238.1 cupin-like domain-containing protein [Nocardia farcinica]MBF6266840.1 cupin-like domain-containing protein [Nocardia farcinica]
MTDKGYDERPLTLAPILGAGFALWLARSVRDRVRPRTGGTPGRVVPDHENLELAEVFDRKTPVVIRDVATAWPVFEDYQPQRLREKYRTEKVYALTSTTNVFTQETSPVELLEYGDVMDAVFDTPRPDKKYYSRAAANPKPLAEQLPATVGGRTQSTAASSVWMGQSGNLTPLHNDPWHGLLIQLHGRKRVRLFPPNEYHNVYGIVPRRVNDPYTRLPDQFDPDTADYPRLRRATSYDVVLDAGDVLYIPMFWWHQVESLDASISYVARYNPKYFEFMRAAFFPMAMRGLLRIVAGVTGRFRRAA